jgi:phosphoserine phosphatase RsbU/P
MKENPQKILVIDDTVANIQILNAIFHQEYEVFFATSGAAGIDVARKEIPDIILLDIMMPGMDGYEICSILKSDPSTESIPVIFVTAMGAEEDEAKGLEAGAIDYITKPISPPIVKARVKNHLELKQGRDMLVQVGMELAAKNATLEKERVLAHRLLEKILPERLDIPGFSTAVFFRPSDEIGGDFFDGWIDGDAAHFFIGDISGHSISAALVMAVCKGLFMTIGKEKSDPSEIIAAANRALARMLSESGMYLTMIYLVCDRKSGILKAASAGHNTAYLYSPAATVSIDATGPPIGWEIDDTWTVSEHMLSKSDKILLYTDGLIETRNSDGVYCNEDFFSGLDSSLTVEEMLHKVFVSAESFCNGVFDDDLTIFAISLDTDQQETGISG